MAIYCNSKEINWVYEFEKISKEEAEGWGNEVKEKKRRSKPC